MRAANQVSVSQAALLFRHSFQLMTPAGNTTDRKRQVDAVLVVVASRVVVQALLPADDTCRGKKQENIPCCSVAML
jgi:hypothetical protein